MTLPMNIPSSNVYQASYSTSLTTNTTSTHRFLPYAMMMQHPHNLMHSYQNMSSSPVAIHMNRLHMSSKSHQRSHLDAVLEEGKNRCDLDFIRPASPSTARRNTIHPFPKLNRFSGSVCKQHQQKLTDLSLSPSTVIAPLPRKWSALDSDDDSSDLFNDDDDDMHLEDDDTWRAHPILTPTSCYLDQDALLSACQELRSIITATPASDELMSSSLLTSFGRQSIHSPGSPFDALTQSHSVLSC